MPGRRGLDAWGSLLRAHAKLVRRLDTDLQRASGLALADSDVRAQLAEAQSGSARKIQADFCLLSRFSATASRMRLFSAPSSISSFSLMSMARLTFPSRLELNRPEASFKEAPLKNVSLTTLL